jgi:putative peptide zinc metalloprotease protein
MRRFLLVLVSAATLCSVIAASPSPTNASDNAAVALNLRDGSSTFRLAFKITRVNRDVVDSSNAAVAAASCTDCQTVAVAIQAVLIFGDPSVITPTNFAFAYNLDCDRCYTLATAYQFVSTTGIVYFTAEGNRRIAAIRQQLEGLRHSDLSIEEIQARVDLLASQLLDVMRTELITPGPASASQPVVADAESAAPQTAPAEPEGNSDPAITEQSDEATTTDSAQPVDPPTEGEPTTTTTEDPPQDIDSSQSTADETTTTETATTPSDAP